MTNYPGIYGLINHYKDPGSLLPKQDLYAKCHEIFDGWPWRFCWKASVFFFRVADWRPRSILGPQHWSTPCDVWFILGYDGVRSEQTHIARKPYIIIIIINNNNIIIIIIIIKPSSSHHETCLRAYFKNHPTKNIHCFRSAPPVELHSLPVPTLAVVLVL